MDASVITELVPRELLEHTLRICIGVNVSATTSARKPIRFTEPTLAIAHARTLAAVCQTCRRFHEAADGRWHELANAVVFPTSFALPRQMPSPRERLARLCALELAPEPAELSVHSTAWTRRIDRSQTAPEASIPGCEFVTPPGVRKAYSLCFALYEAEPHSGDHVVIATAQTPLLFPGPLGNELYLLTRATFDPPGPSPPPDPGSSLRPQSEAVRMKPSDSEDSYQDTDAILIKIAVLRHADGKVAPLASRSGLSRDVMDYGNLMGDSDDVPGATETQDNYKLPLRLRIGSRRLVFILMATYLCRPEVSRTEGWLRSLRIEFCGTGDADANVDLEDWCSYSCIDAAFAQLAWR